MADPITSYNRVPPPADPESSHAHLDGELNKLERTTASLIANMGTLETTYATIVDLDAEEAARIAADAAEVTARNTAITSAVAGEATARTAADALKADKTYVDTQDAAEAAARATAEALLAPKASPTFTGVPAAPTAAVGTNTTQVATTEFVQSAKTWHIASKSADQSFTSNTTLTDLTDLTVPVSASKTYVVRAVVLTTAGATGGIKMAFACPAGFTKFRQQAIYTTTTATSPQSIHSGFSASLVNTTSASSTLMWILEAVLVNGVNAGNLVLQGAQSASNATATTFERGSYIEWSEIA